jgi:FkbM family methyltransferase
MEQDLIYDVGLHNGDDTAHYLSKGFRVVGIEADPNLVTKAMARFDKEIKQDRLKLLNVAIGPQEGIRSFWLCDGLSEWNSFDRAVASRLGFPHHAVDVHCRRFADILKEHGVPYYLKVDIEKSDQFCLKGINLQDRPEYVSVEASCFEDLLALRGLGYNAFKIIYQAPGYHHTQFRSIPTGTPAQVTKAISSAANMAVAPNPSGPFGEQTDGNWDNFDVTAYHLLSFLLGHSQHGNPPDWFVWFDIHATNRADILPTAPLYD